MTNPITTTTRRRATARRMTTAAAAAGLALGLTACSTGGTTGPAADDATATAKPHGYVEGASEAQEPQVRLLAVSASGETAVHDLLSGDTTALDDVDAPEHSATDGRFLVTSSDDRTTIVDGGAWTVDHGDHTHYYAARPRVVGTFGEQLVAGTADGVRVLDADGEPTGAEAACTDPAGGIVTRAGAVVGCSDGAVVVGEDGEAETVELPGGAERPTAFSARAGRPAVAGIAGDRGAWLLDSREGSWRLVETERPLRAVTAVDDEDEHVVGVDDLGRVVVLTASTGAVATTESLLDPDQQPLLQLDAQRAYVADASGQQVHEIDFADGARVARSIDLPAAPVAFAEVGL